MSIEGGTTGGSGRILPLINKREDSGSESDVSNSDGGDGGRIFQLKITLRDTKPPIWRRVQVPEDFDFLKLHKALNVTMGWRGTHLHEFRGGKGFVIGDQDDSDDEGDSDSDEDKDTGEFGGKRTSVKIGQVFSPNFKAMSYLYDFGDSWYHFLLLEKVLPREEGVVYPRCITGKRACPPEDCGGTPGYEELLESLRDSKHKEHKENEEWLKRIGHEKFDPEHFDPASVNERLVKIFFPE